MSLLVATQITAVATMVLAVGAVVSAVFAFLAFRKQSVEVTALLSESRREADTRHREQAVRVLVWLEHLTGQHGQEDIPAHAVVAHIRNTSNHPIYDMTCYWYHERNLADKPGYVIGPLIPASEYSVEELDFGNIGIYPVIEFRDINGTGWRAGPDGSLKEVGLAIRSGPGSG